jgi:hypothetical protein
MAERPFSSPFFAGVILLGPSWKAQWTFSIWHCWLFLSFYSFIHMCIHCLGHFSPLPPLLTVSYNFFLWYWGLNSEPPPSNLATPLAPFFLCVKDFFKIGSRELFALDGFEPQSSWFLPPE